MWSERQHVDYALARRATLQSLFGGGSVCTTDVCDADPYLLRAAKYHGEATDVPCPVCRREPLRHVTYVFGDELGHYSGRIKATAELEQMAHEYGEFTVYVVEVCAGCSWNHLSHSYVLGDGVPRERSQRRQAARMKPFRRRPPNSAPASGPLHPDDDQWFRPEPTQKGRGARRSGKRGKDATPPPSDEPTKPVVPPSPDDPTETIDVPPDWKDATARIQRVVEFPPGTEPAPPVSPDVEPTATRQQKKPSKRRNRLRKFAWGMLSLITVAFLGLLFAFSQINIPDPNLSATRATTTVFYADGQEAIGRFGEVNREPVQLGQGARVTAGGGAGRGEPQLLQRQRCLARAASPARFWVNLRGGAHNRAARRSPSST